MKKEIITKEKIKTEAVRGCVKGIKSMAITLTFMLVLLVIIYLLLKELKSVTMFYKIILLSPIVFFGPILHSLVIFDNLKHIKAIKNNDFKILTDRLVSTADKVETGAPFTGAFLASFAKPYRLYFEKYGEYRIYKGNHYVTSEMFCMNADGVYNYSAVDDIFYLIILDKKHILLAYNSKLFQLEE